MKEPLMNVERKRLPFVLATGMTVPLLTLLLLAVDVEAKTRRLTADNATWRAECSGYHVAYPPALLPAADWRQLMGSLTRHFGADASVDPSVATEIDRFLAANAGRGDSRATEAQPGSRPHAGSGTSTTRSRQQSFARRVSRRRRTARHAIPVPPPATSMSTR
jgi:hypothetical protein